MELKYDISEYIVMARMSSKVRILVEGKDDRGHVLNLLNKLAPKARLKVDTAIDVVGDCNVTRNNNRAKIEKIHAHCKEKQSHRKLFFLCDREFRNFLVSEKIEESVNGHEVDGNLSWTLGHSIENYFLSPVMLAEGFRFLSGSGSKSEAVDLFSDFFDDSVRKIAAITLAAKDLNCANFPCSIVRWDNIVLNEGTIDFGFRRDTGREAFYEKFVSTYEAFLLIVERTPVDVCARLCRGHTAVLILQRLFAACLYESGKAQEEDLARYDANMFNNVSEHIISSALSEAWISKIAVGGSHYPQPLVQLVIDAA
jgi:hypothetical protein